MSYFLRNDPKCIDLDLEFEFRGLNMFFGRFSRFENARFWTTDFFIRGVIIFRDTFFNRDFQNNTKY